MWDTGPRPIRIEIRWRWGELRDAIVLLDPHLIETNICLLEAADVQLPRSRALIHLVEYVETLPWRAPVRRLLLASRH